MGTRLLIEVLGISVVITFSNIAQEIGAHKPFKQHRPKPVVPIFCKRAIGLKCCMPAAIASATTTSSQDRTGLPTEFPSLHDMPEKGSIGVTTLASLTGLLCGIIGTIIVMMITSRIKAGIDRTRTTNTDQGHDNPSMETEVTHPESSIATIDASSDPFSERPSRKYYEIIDTQTTRIHCETDYASIRSQRQQLVSGRTNSGYEIPMMRAIQGLPGIIDDSADENSYLETPASVPRYQNWIAEIRDARSTQNS